MLYKYYTTHSIFCLEKILNSFKFNGKFKLGGVVMNNDISKKSNVISIIGKIIASFGIIITIFIILLTISLSVCFDGNWNTTISNFGWILPIMLILLVWNKRNRKIIGIFTILLTLILISNIIYYENYSMKIEPLIYLHTKYNLPFFDMKIVETTRSSRPLFWSEIHRSATIKYNEYNIYVYYEDGWKDDYSQKIKFNEKDEIITKKFN